MQAIDALRMWPSRRWGVAAIAAVVSTVALAIPTALIPNPVFGRAIAPEWWSWPVTIVTGILAGLLVATYVAIPRSAPAMVFGQVSATVAAADSTPDGALDAPGESRPDHPNPEHTDPERLDRAGKAGVIGGLVSFFAVGCPVCNKLVLIALGTTGAVQWFAPIQPILAVAAIALLVWALRRRLLNETRCSI